MPNGDSWLLCSRDVKEAAAVAAFAVVQGEQVVGCEPAFDRAPMAGVRIVKRPSMKIISLHAGGRQQWDQLVERTAEMWLSYEGLTLEQISAIDTPALVIAGDRDELVGLDLSLRLYQVLSNAALAVCPQADHSAPMTVERAPTFAALVADFASRMRTG